MLTITVSQLPAPRHVAGLAYVVYLEGPGELRRALCLCWNETDARRIAAALEARGDTQHGRD